MSQDPATSIQDAVQCITEAATLHLALGEQATENAVSKALVWRFDIGGFAARECYAAALKLLDAMPRNR